MGDLYNAAREGNLKKVNQLIDSETNVDQSKLYGRTPLYIASAGGYTDVCALLIDRGADVNQADDDGWTPLLIASQCGHVKVCALLLDNGADVGQANNDGWTPLLGASLDGHADVCALLLDRGANVNRARDTGETPLHVASKGGYREVCALLLDRGANVNQAGVEGTTPLIIASDRGILEVCKLLIERGADVNRVDYGGTSALMYASMHGLNDICALLIRYGAETRHSDLNKLDDSITDALCQRPLVDLRDTLVYPTMRNQIEYRHVENLEPMIKIMRHVEFIVLDEQLSDFYTVPFIGQQPHELFPKLLQEKVALRKDSIQNIISALQIARGQLDSKYIQNAVMSYLYVKMATILKNVPDGGIEELRAMKRNHSEAFESYKHPIEKQFDDQVRPYREEFKRLIRARAEIRHDYMHATRPPPAKKTKKLHEEMNALRF